jgi:pyruvate ferredoxin oxidoreductase gamma subunit
MFQVRFHGRGGQGVVTTAELLSVAAFVEGRYAQAFPSFGAERTGAPVEAYCRIAERPIRLREPVRQPDAVVVQDATLRLHLDIIAGLAPGGYLLINSLRDWDGLGLDMLGDRIDRERTVIVPASELAVEHLGRPMPGAALLGGLAALTGQVGLEALTVAIRRRFPARVAIGNVDAAGAAYAHVLGRPARDPARRPDPEPERAHA